MKQRLIPLGLALILAGCGPLSIWYKPDTPVARMEQALFECRVDGAQKIPVNTQVRRTPVRYVPREICDSDGNCTVFMDRIGGDIYTYDANRALRQQVIAQCMTRKGYTQVDIPPCSAAVRNAVPTARTTILPKLGDRACSIRNSDGSWQIVNVAG